MAIRYISPIELATLMRAGKNDFKVVDVRGELALLQALLQVVVVSHSIRHLIFADSLPSRKIKTLKEEICELIGPVYGQLDGRVFTHE